MYDMTKYLKYWQMKFIDGNILNIQALTGIEYSKLLNIMKDLNETNLTECVLIIINNNKEHIIYTAENIDNLLNKDLEMEFINNYFDWLNKELNQKN